VHVDPVSADQFVNGRGLDVQTSERSKMASKGVNHAEDQAFSLDVQTFERSRSNLSKPSRAVIERVDGRTLRRMTVYLPAELAKRLALYCTEHERDMSDVIARSVARTLGRSDV
jgi:hypothetical protein